MTGASDRDRESCKKTGPTATKCEALARHKEASTCLVPAFRATNARDDAFCRCYIPQVHQMGVSLASPAGCNRLRARIRFSYNGCDQPDSRGTCLMSAVESPIDRERTLRERFELEHFRAGQREVIEHVLRGQDVLC